MDFVLVLCLITAGFLVGGVLGYLFGSHAKTDFVELGDAVAGQYSADKAHVAGMVAQLRELEDAGKIKAGSVVAYLERESEMPLRRAGGASVLVMTEALKAAENAVESAKV